METFKMSHPDGRTAMVDERMETAFAEQGFVRGEPVAETSDACDDDDEERPKSSAGSRLSGEVENRKSAAATPGSKPLVAPKVEDAAASTDVPPTRSRPRS